MHNLLKYLRNYKKESVLGPFFKLLEASFELVVPLVMANIIDIGIKNKDNPYIARMAAILILLGIVGLACSITAQYFAAKAAVGFSTELRSDLFHKITQLSYKEQDISGSSTLITRITSDVNQIQTGVNLFLRLFLRSPFIVFGAMIMAFKVNVKSAFVFVVAIPLLALVVIGVMLLTIPLYKKVQQSLDKILLTTKENLVGVRVIRAFCRQSKEKKSFLESSDSLYRMQIVVGKISAVLNPLTYILVNAALIMIIYVSAHEVNRGIIMQGEVIALVNYMSQILIELIKLVNLIITFTKSLACAGRVDEILQMNTSIKEPEQVAGPSSDQASVSFEQVSFSYHEGSEYALKDISFSVLNNQTVGVIGGTGSGKSTLINLIPRFYDASKGQVLVKGTDVKQYSLDQLRCMIGLVPQKAVLFKGTIRENLVFGQQDISDDEIMKALEIAQGIDIINSKSEGLDTMITQGGKNLSGGQKQRLTIARALLRHPKILILDDSSSALDYATDARLRKALHEKCSDMTVFLISQRASTVQNADQILVLDDGKLVGKGTHDQLLKDCEIYQEICNSQTTDKEAVS